MTSLKNIAALLTCHNRREKTLLCLKNLYDCRLPEGFLLDVFLVDDGSTDGTSDAVRDRFPSVNIISGAGDLFWNRGMHLAWTEAAKKDYDYYLWINDDTFLYPNAISELIECSKQENDQKICCGSTCAVSDKNKITYGGRITKKGKELIPNGQRQKCDYFNGNLVLIPKSVYALLGPNDPHYRHAVGDYEYGLRAARNGIESVVAPYVSGECDEHESLSGWCNPQVPMLKRLKLLYSPLGNHPIEFFRFENMHYGLRSACFHFITNHLRAICPYMWGQNINKLSI